MSVQIKQPMPGMIRHTHIRSKTGPHQTRTKTRFNLGAVYVVGSSLVIWGSFIWAIWSLI